MRQFFFLLKVVIVVAVVAAVIYFVTDNSGSAQVSFGPIGPLQVRVYLLVITSFCAGCVLTASYFFVKQMIDSFSKAYKSRPRLRRSAGAKKKSLSAQGSSAGPRAANEKSSLELETEG